MFSETRASVSELIKGDPDKPLREPVMALFAVVFNLFAVYQANETVRQYLLWMNPHDPIFAFLFLIVVGLVGFIIGFAVFYSVMLLIGAVIIRYVHRRGGAVLILVFSIIALLVGLSSMGFTSFGLLIASIIGFLAGIFGIRTKREVSSRDVLEII